MGERVRVITDPNECREVWQRVMPADLITDLWEVRDCFQRHYRRRPLFLAAENGHGLDGLLPLCWIEEEEYYGYFPGETWHGKTWLEQNRIVAYNDEALRELLRGLHRPYQVRYLVPPVGMPEVLDSVDETGYLFFPGEYQYSLDEFFKEFSHKSEKKLKRQLAEFAEMGLEYRLDDVADFQAMVDLNVQRFGDESYFSDPRFYRSMLDLMQFLRERGWLRFTTVLLGGQVAAIDMGCIYNGVYTLLAGGTSGAFPGVAKLINLYHIRRACEERLDCVDFLCGDFSWKPLFHLRPRPLYLLSSQQQQLRSIVPVAAGSVARAS